MVKKLILSLSVFFVAICLFSGCASVDAVSIIYADSSRALNYSFKFNKSTLNQHGIDFTDAVAQAKECADDYWEQLGYHFKTTQASYVSALNSKTSNFEVRITFDNYDKYCLFHNVMPNDDKTKPTLEEGLLITKQILLDSKNVGDIFLNILNLPYQREGQTLDKTVGEVMIENIATGLSKSTSVIQNLLKTMSFDVSFAFATGLKIHSNADFVTYTIDQIGVGNEELARYTVHTWECSLNSSPEVMIYKNVLTRNNLYAWYGLAIVAAIVFGLILWLVFYVKHKNSESVYRQANFPSASVGDDYDRTQDYEMPSNSENSSQNESIAKNNEEKNKTEEDKRS